MSYEVDVRTSVASVTSGISGLESIGVKIRKRPFFSKEHGDTFPLIVISSLPEKIAKLHMPNGIWWDYPILVTLIQENGATLGSLTEYNWQSNTRQAIRDALYQPSLAGVTSVFDVDYDPHPIVDLGGLDSLFDISLQLFTFRIATTR